MGINAYFPLRPINRAPISEGVLYGQLVRGWEDAFAEIDRFKSDQDLGDMPIFFTEMGFTSKENCTVTPWKGDGYSLVTEGTFDTLLVWQTMPTKSTERVLAVEALYKVVDAKDIPLSGISFWKLTSYAGHLEIEPFALVINDTPRDELEAVLRRFVKE